MAVKTSVRDSRDTGSGTGIDTGAGSGREPGSGVPTGTGVEPGTEPATEPGSGSESESESEFESEACTTPGSGSDPEAEFQSYMTARWPALVRTAYLLTGGDRHLAEDLAQVALTRVYAHWGRIRKVADVDAYVRRTLVNANARRFRKRRVGEWLTGLLPERDVAGSGGAGDGIEARSVLMAALAGLPVRQRQVVVLRYWEDLSEKEVAEALGIAPGTVKSQASKAIARLRTDPGLLAEYGPGAGPLSAIRVEGTL